MFALHEFFACPTFLLVSHANFEIYALSHLREFILSACRMQCARPGLRVHRAETKVDGLPRAASYAAWGNVTRRACLKSNSIETHEKLRQRQGKLTSRWAKTIWDFWSVFLNFLAM